MTKALIFDMDGTLADLYSVDGWLEDLHTEKIRPYELAKPIYDMNMLNEILKLFHNNGWKIIITTWTAKKATKKYHEKIQKAKKEWLEKYGFPYDEMYCVKYGTQKDICTSKKFDYQILIDDDEKVRKNWTLGDTIDAKSQNILKILIDILLKEYAKEEM